MNQGGVPGGLVAQAAGGDAAQFNPYISEVASNELASNQLDRILADDSVLMQRSRALAMQDMNARGLINSSMAQGAGVAAMIDRATPIAQQDASTYSERALANAAARNEAGRFNAGETNKFRLQTNDQRFTATENAANRSFEAGENAANRSFTAAQNALDRSAKADLEAASRAFQASENEKGRAAEIMLADKRITADQALEKSRQEFTSGENKLSREANTADAEANRVFTREQNEADRAFNLTRDANNQAFQTQERLAGQSFTSTENALNRTFTEIQAKSGQAFEREMVQLRSDLDRANIPMTQAANITTSLLNTVNAISLDPNLDAAAKDTAIANAYGAANATIGYTSKLYNIPLPTVTAPTRTTPTGGSATGSYFQQNPDVAAEYERSGRANGMSPEEYATYHYNTYGRAEGRTAP